MGVGVGVKRRRRRREEGRRAKRVATRLFLCVCVVWFVFFWGGGQKGPAFVFVRCIHVDIIDTLYTHTDTDTHIYYITWYMYI